MNPATSNLFYQILIPSIVLFFLVWSVVGVGVGVGLIVAHARLLRMFGTVNRYVSTRHELKALADVHDVETQMRKNRRWIGALFILGAAYSIFGLVSWFDNQAIVAALGLDLPQSYVAWIVDGLRWALIVCSAFALLVGTLLCFRPEVVYWLERHADRWYSFRQLFSGVDTMHAGLDRWVAAFPRTAGGIIVIGALVVAADSATLWQQLR